MTKRFSPVFALAAGSFSCGLVFLALSFGFLPIVGLGAGMLVAGSVLKMEPWERPRGVPEASRPLGSSESEE